MSGRAWMVAVAIIELAILLGIVVAALNSVAKAWGWW